MTPDLDVHIIDFGMSTLSGDYFPYNPSANNYWMAPEVLYCCYIPTAPSSDVYSFRQLIHEAFRNINAKKIKKARASPLRASYGT